MTGVYISIYKKQNLILYIFQTMKIMTPGRVVVRAIRIFRPGCDPSHNL